MEHIEAGPLDRPLVTAGVARDNNVIATSVEPGHERTWSAHS